MKKQQPALSRHPGVAGLVEGVREAVRSRLPALEEPAHRQACLDELDREVTSLVQRFGEQQLDHLYELVQIGLGLSSEKRIERLLERIVGEARRFTNADGATLYVLNREKQLLEFAIVQNESLKVHMGGSGGPVSWPPVPLRLPDGRENHRNVSAHCALAGELINIADVDQAAGFDFEGTREFDAATGFRSRSMLVVPMNDYQGEVIGVLQLLNARDRRHGDIVPFPADEEEMVASLASQAAVALTNVRLVQELEALLNGFIETIAEAIDEKSPYTAGHIYRVAELTERLLRAVNQADAGPLARVFFSEEQVAEIRMAAWLHDIGKITTPEFMVDKATKLETVYDRIEVVRSRIEILKRDRQIERLRQQLGWPQAGDGREPEAAAGADTRDLDEILAFLEEVNLGGESLSRQSLERIRRIACIPLRIGGQQVSLLDADEIKNLSIHRGTLTDEERQLVSNHVKVSIKMLERLPFPSKLARVPLYVGLHHEKLDGSGYPKGLTEADIPLPGRILAVADIFEALTAADRPYKRGKMLSEAMRILEEMVAEHQLDEAVCDLLVSSGLAREYALSHLAPRQVDDFSWKGRRYPVRSAAGEDPRSSVSPGSVPWNSARNS